MKKINGEKSPFNFSKQQQNLCQEYQNNDEKFVGLVGPVGAGTSVTSSILQDKFEQRGLEVVLIKASQLIRSISVPTTLGIKRLNTTFAGNMHNVHYWANDIRKGVHASNIRDQAAIARLVLKYIIKSRTNKFGQSCPSYFSNSDRKPIVYLIDSIRNPAESEVFRHVYGESFYLLGVGCDSAVRAERLRRKIEQTCERVGAHTNVRLKEILENDSNTNDKYGQQVANTFLDADYFVDNAEDWGDHFSNAKITSELNRFVDWVIGSNTLSSTIVEETMFEAFKASLKSTNLVNQVGASLVDADGQFVGIGSSDIPNGGDELFKKSFNTAKNENGRCVFCNNPNFFDIIEHDQMIDEIVEKVASMSNEVDAGELNHIIRSVLLKHKLEFSRVIHAEIDAIITAIRSGISTIGCKMFVTSFPCQACIGYIASAGINELIYLEPYPSREIFEQFSNSITTISSGWIPPSSMRLIYSSNVANQIKNSRMLFRPYVGVAPSRFQEVFLNDEKVSQHDVSEFEGADSESENNLNEQQQSYFIKEQEYSQFRQIGG